MLHEAGRLGPRAGGHLVDHQPRSAIERQLLTQHRRGPRQRDAEALAELTGGRAISETGWRCDRGGGSRRRPGAAAGSR